GQRARGSYPRLAARGRVLGCLHRHAEHDFLPAFHLPQIAVLDGVVRLGEPEWPAWALEANALERGDQILLRAGISLDLSERLRERVHGVVAGHGVDVRVASRRLLEGVAELPVGGVVERIGVVQRRLDALGGGPLRREDAFGEEAGTVEGDAA